MQIEACIKVSGRFVREEHVCCSFVFIVGLQAT